MRGCGRLRRGLDCGGGFSHFFGRGGSLGCVKHTPHQRSRGGGFDRGSSFLSSGSLSRRDIASATVAASATTSVAAPASSAEMLPSVDTAASWLHAAPASAPVFVLESGAAVASNFSSPKVEAYRQWSPVGSYHPRCFFRGLLQGLVDWCP